MAKLSARNRTCLVEVTREYTEAQLQAAHDRRHAQQTPGYVPGSEASLCVWERVTRRLMSDGTVLQKLDVRFRPSPTCSWEDPNGRRHSYGWKVHGTLKAGNTADDYRAIYAGPTKSGKPSPWTVNGTPAGKTVVLSQKRILRAVESGESIGFCQACGREQDGCEPDARGYQCHSCGQFEVYGAEELLSAI